MGISVESFAADVLTLLNGRQLIVVSNREPYQIKRHNTNLTLEKTTGGLVSALDTVLQQSNGLWICWSGTQEQGCDFNDLCRLAELNRVALPYRIQAVRLSSEEIQHYYFGFANQQLWPLFHYFPFRHAFSEEDWKHYTMVNYKFARAVAENAGPEDLIWVQDYHLMRVPEYVRQFKPKANLGFFCHIPFPHYEMFRTLPTRREILQGILGSDLIGFHTPLYARYFMECAEFILAGEVKVLDDQTLNYQGRTIRVQAFPISIDFNAVNALALQSSVDEAALQIRQALQPAEFVGLGVDRLDYTKGILERLECIALFFKRFPQYRRRLVFVQVAVPSRMEVPEYQRMKQDIDEAVGRINGMFSEDGWVPIHYFYRGYPMEELVAYYKAADFALVNPLRDGMNLVAKEYCAARPDESGALILSEMTGAAYQLTESYLVNPYDHPQVVQTIYNVLNESPRERQRRMKSLREGIARDNIEAWLLQYVGAFLDALGQRD